MIVHFFGRSVILTIDIKQLTHSVDECSVDNKPSQQQIGYNSPQHGHMTAHWYVGVLLHLDDEANCFSEFANIFSFYLEETN